MMLGQFMTTEYLVRKGNSKKLSIFGYFGEFSF